MNIKTRFIDFILEFKKLAAEVYFEFNAQLFNFFYGRLLKKKENLNKIKSKCFFSKKIRIKIIRVIIKMQLKQLVYLYLILKI